MKTANLTDPALDFAVALIKYPEWRDQGYLENFHDLKFDDGEVYSPSTDWAQGGPIIEREGMLIEFHGDHWSATVWWDDGDSANEVKQKGPTPLIAAMRCYVAAKLGDEVDLPDELAEATA